MTIDTHAPAQSPPIRPLGFFRHLGVEVAETFSAKYRMVRKGLPFKALVKFQRVTSLLPGELNAAVQIPPRTMVRRKASGRLEPDESDRLVRIARIFDLVLELYEGNTEQAVEWLLKPQRGLGGEVPLRAAATDIGAREIEDLVGRLEHGVIT